MTLREYLERVGSDELALQQAYEQKNGPQGEDRADWRMAYICFWIATTMGGAKQVTVGDYLPSFEVVEEPELIEGDADLIERREKELFTKFVGLVKQATGVEPNGGSGETDSAADL